MTKEKFNLKMAEALGWVDFWQDRRTGKWYAYRDEYLQGPHGYEAERGPIPDFTDFQQIQELDWLWSTWVAKLTPE